MSSYRYQLLSLLGEGEDGMSYRTCDTGDGTLVELGILRGPPADISAWSALVKRLRLAAMLDHPGAARVRELDLLNDSV